MVLKRREVHVVTQMTAAETAQIVAGCACGPTLCSGERAWDQKVSTVRSRRDEDRMANQCWRRLSGQPARRPGPPVNAEPSPQADPASGRPPGVTPCGMGTKRDEAATALTPWSGHCRTVSCHFRSGVSPGAAPTRFDCDLKSGAWTGQMLGPEGDAAKRRDLKHCVTAPHQDPTSQPTRKGSVRAEQRQRQKRGRCSAWFARSGCGRMETANEH